jgi:hypothetical protein
VPTATRTERICKRERAGVSLTLALDFDRQKDVFARGVNFREQFSTAGAVGASQSVFFVRVDTLGAFAKKTPPARFKCVLTPFTGQQLHPDGKNIFPTTIKVNDKII